MVTDHDPHALFAIQLGPYIFLAQYWIRLELDLFRTRPLDYLSLNLNLNLNLRSFTAPARGSRRLYVCRKVHWLLAAAKVEFAASAVALRLSATGPTCNVNLGPRWPAGPRCNSLLLLVDIYSRRHTWRFAFDPLVGPRSNDSISGAACEARARRKIVN